MKIETFLFTTSPIHLRASHEVSDSVCRLFVFQPQERKVSIVVICFESARRFVGLNNVQRAAQKKLFNKWMRVRRRVRPRNSQSLTCILHPVITRQTELNSPIHHDGQEVDNTRRGSVPREQCCSVRSPAEIQAGVPVVDFVLPPVVLEVP